MSSLSEIPFGRKILNESGKRILRCRCDASTLTLPLPAPVPGSFCQFCGIKKPKSK